MKRKLAKEALYSRDRHHAIRTGHDDIPAMQNLTAERIEQIDPEDHRAQALLRKFGKPSKQK